MTSLLSSIQYFLLSLTISLVSGIENPIVQTSHGTIKGTTGVSRDGRTFYAFRGIPYAKPPTGKLRFKPPQELDPWSGIYNAQENAPACMQKNYLFGKSTEGSEDCLYINVYTPKLRGKKDALQASLLPVMVFIHWGGFFAGYSSSDYLGPEYFMDKNVVLVTFNYRLGVLGFLSTSDDVAPGNYGLKDQTAALKWVQNNIQNFYGNKRKVTLFGQSAGGASVHFHMLSPLSKNLFHQSISESGTALALWAKPAGEEQLIIAKLQATLVGCGGVLNETFHLVNCLRSIDAKTLINSGDKFKYFSVDPLTVYLPSIEKETDGNPKPFLTKEPIDYILSNEVAKVPWILGTVSDEGIIRAAPLLSQSATRTNLTKEFNKIMPTLMALVMSTPNEKVQVVWKKIKDRYFEGRNSVNISDMTSVQGLVDLYTDRSFAYSVYQTALIHSMKGHDPIWLYNFQYKGQHSYRPYFVPTKESIDYDWGVSHCDELLYLFKSPAIFPELTNPRDVFMSKILVKLWTNFAIYGDPTPNFNFSNEKRWMKLERNVFSAEINKTLRFLNITGTLKNKDPVQMDMNYGFHKNRFRFWEELPLVENIDDLHQQHIEL